MIVVIDDDERMRVLARQYLSMIFDGRYRIVACPPEEYETIDWSDVKVAIVDLMMDPVPGTTILSWLRDHHSTIKRVAWSAAVPKPGGYMNPLVEEAQIVADAVVSKLSLDDLADAIEKLRGDRRTALRRDAGKNRRAR